MTRFKKDPAKYNKLADPFNATLKEMKLRKAALDALRQKQAKITDSQSDYGDAALAGANKADVAVATYAQLAEDPDLKAAIAKYNAGSAQPLKLGPSGNFANDAAFLKKCVSDLTAEGVPARMQGGVPVVEVIVNGKKHDMIWDSGASVVSLSTETAAEFGLRATAQDRTVVSTVADGRQVEAKLIVVPEIRVGAFSAQNIECLISPVRTTPRQT
jgi:clan AA aspartic protease (TIGR02281 family)